MNSQVCSFKCALCILKNQAKTDGDLQVSAESISADQDYTTTGKAWKFQVIILLNLIV